MHGSRRPGTHWASCASVARLCKDPVARRRQSRGYLQNCCSRHDHAPSEPRKTHAKTTVCTWQNLDVRALARSALHMASPCRRISSGSALNGSSLMALRSAWLSSSDCSGIRKVAIRAWCVVTPVNTTTFRCSARQMHSGSDHPTQDPGNCSFLGSL